MSAIPNKKIKKSSDYKSLVIIIGIVSSIGLAGFAYLMYYVEPVEVLETVKIVAVTDSGCIAETLDGHAVNIGECNAEPGQYISALVDQKVKERAELMNPTN
ncbi:hypothetical protein [Nitrosopumilus maritimus]|uniref:Uncharacterized protein n=1 Tax=Nitrosopumilus maritimus (strain SCM1) TaxID=436308 RepID=A9A562_NITMS|nr:hypothetical protein [Nitrosopumilus maritimus]ABX12261.1 hypothetical protein Nmar_0365 [Nitrosopumilus maritimus SCM1]